MPGARPLKSESIFDSDVTCHAEPSEREFSTSGSCKGEKGKSHGGGIDFSEAQIAFYDSLCPCSSKAVAAEVLARRGYLAAIVSGIWEGIGCRA